MYKIEDFSEAYVNGAYIPQSERWPAAWDEPAAKLRDELLRTDRAELDIRYGDGARNWFDLFHPQGAARGLVVFIHGGYWLRFGPRSFSHLAAGALAHGYAVAMPAYTLCPDIRISGIVREIGAAIAEAAERVGGPIRITGHSAGGHLAGRMACADAPLPEAVRGRIAHVLPISGLPDLRPLQRTGMNETLRLDDAEARAESPALLEPAPGMRVTCWVGSDERPEFLRQNALLAKIWGGLGIETSSHIEAGKHHFDIVDGLADPDSALTAALLG